MLLHCRVQNLVMSGTSCRVLYLLRSFPRGSCSRREGTTGVCCTVDKKDPTYSSTYISWNCVGGRVEQHEGEFHFLLWQGLNHHDHTRPHLTYIHLLNSPCFPRLCSLSSKAQFESSAIIVFATFFKDLGFSSGHSVRTFLAKTMCLNFFCFVSSSVLSPQLAKEHTESTTDVSSSNQEAGIFWMRRGQVRCGHTPPQ